MVGGGGMGFNHGDEIEVPGIELTSMPLYGKADPFLSSADWDPAMSTMVSSKEFSNPHYTSLIMDNPRMSYVDTSQKLLLYGNNSSVGIPDCNQIGHSFGSNKRGEDEGALNKAGESCEHLEVSEEGFIGASPNRKRGRPELELAPPLQWNKKAVEEFQKDVSMENIDVVQEQQSQKKTELEQTKETMNKDNSQDGEARKENYIHVRARRGQATNSHSLAERVRREKISERMRLLQELVPGCNKITGKALMLDEIINYVQSLQQQVEFLSMKLATVNPELNIDVERILTKDFLDSRERNTPMLGIGQGMNPSHPYGIIQGTMASIPTANPQINSSSQTELDSELQSIYQMGFVSNSSNMDSFLSNGRLKPEL